MNKSLANRIRSHIDGAKNHLDLARQQRTTLAELQSCRLCEAVKVAREWCNAIDGGISMPGEEVICMMPARPLSDEAALGLWKMFIAPAIRGAKSGVTGRSGLLDFAEDGSLASEDRIARDWSDLFGLLAESAGEKEAKVKATKTRHRKPSKETTSRLTSRQLEALKLYGDLHGNMSEVAKLMGISRQAAKKHYDAGNSKMGIKATQKAKTKRIGMDHLGSGRTIKRTMDEDDE